MRLHRDMVKLELILRLLPSQSLDLISQHRQFVRLGQHRCYSSVVCQSVQGLVFGTCEQYYRRVWNDFVKHEGGLQSVYLGRVKIQDN